MCTWYVRQRNGDNCENSILADCHFRAFISCAIILNRVVKNAYLVVKFDCCDERIKKNMKMFINFFYLTHKKKVAL